MRTVHRSKTNKVVFGIFGGMGEYFDVDPVLFRLMWLFVTVFTGIIPGIFIYIVAFLIVPKNII